MKRGLAYLHSFGNRYKSQFPLSWTCAGQLRSVNQFTAIGLENLLGKSVERLLTHGGNAVTLKDLRSLQHEDAEELCPLQH